jgi:SAM-dependent methyltransferase
MIMNKSLFRTFLKKIQTQKIEKMYGNYLNNPSWACYFKEKYFPADILIENRWILDFGCGRGRHVALLSQLGGKIVGIDVRSHAFWRKIPNAYFVLASDKELLCIKDNTFDIFIAIQLLEYLEDDNRALGEIFRILKDGGCLLIQVPNKTNLYTLLRGKTIVPEINLKKYYEIYEIENLLKSSGFVIERLWTEKFYAPIIPIPVNYFLEILLPPWIEKMVSQFTPSRYRGLINVVARKIEVC